MEVLDWFCLTTSETATMGWQLMRDDEDLEIERSLWVDPRKVVVVVGFEGLIDG